MPKTHCLSHTRPYRIWCHIKDRCTNPKMQNYRHYGGKGVKMCCEWDEDFMAFHRWAMANGYREDLTIERIDGNGDYEPSNCRWATWKEQANNTTRNHLVTINGATKTIAGWADSSGIRYQIIRDRLYGGMTGERLLNPEKRRGHKWYTIKNETHDLKGWASVAGLSYTTFLGRLQRGFTVEELVFAVG